MATQILQLEEVNVSGFEGIVSGRLILRLAQEKQIYKEGIASHVGRIDYPKWLGGVAEILQLNKTTVNLSYNPNNLDMPGNIYIHGEENDREATKQILERMLNTKLMRTR